MISIAGIYTNRDTQQPYYWDVVYEWEDQLAKSLNVPVIPIGPRYDRIYEPSPLRKILNRIGFYQTIDRFFFRPSQYFLAFHIGPPGIYSFHSRINVIPLIIDFWRGEDLQRFSSIFSLSKYVLISSREAYDYLVNQNLKLNLRHLPLSLPDYLLREKTIVEKRRFDIVHFGRQNKDLEEYMKLLVSELPQINYVYSRKNNGRLEMFSTVEGELGSFDSRESFLRLISQARICLVSAPGLDEDRHRTGGFSPVTPRFFEAAACACHLIGIYPDNSDFRFNEIDKICVNVRNYETFKSAVLHCLGSPQQPDHTAFLQRHVTSKTADKLKQILC